MNHSRLADLYFDIRKFLEALWAYLWLTERGAVQILVATATILASITIGLCYADVAFVNVYVILLWLYSVVICFAILYPAKRPMLPHFDRTWIGLIVLLAFAFFLRFVNLQNFPPGFHTDENGMVDGVLRHVFNPLNGQLTLNPFRTGGDSHPILYYYFFRLGIWLGGFSFVGARLSSVVAGSLAVPAVFLMINELAGRRMAWITTILLAVYQYHLHWSRIALNNIWVTLWLPLAIGFFLAGWRKRTTAGALLAGLSLGLTAYFYAGGYILLILMPVLIWQTWRQTKNRLGLSIYLGKMIAMALVVSAPLIVFAVRFPGSFFDRARTIAAWSPADIQLTVGSPTGYWEYFLYRMAHAFGGYNFYAEHNGFYGPGIPFLAGPASVLFLFGIVWSLYRKQYFPVFWISLVSLIGGFLVVGFAASSHYIGAIPAICWLVAVPIDRLFENKRPIWAYMCLALVIFVDLFFYFVIYQTHPSVELILPFPHVEPYIY